LSTLWKGIAMERRWPAAEAPDESDSERSVARRVRTLRWDEIARLIEVNADGSWYPTEFARARLIHTHDELVLEV
jgi:hypothetical protein